MYYTCMICGGMEQTDRAFGTNVTADAFRFKS
jgi:hypothetical protein